ncbi:hypothetical protein [Brachybacterium massiliense]|uniref:hypothetical protein n=1 Tax=Brachybacterium massiliense TaxID=1755098 RepID=UPI0011200A22|nr:hypothetical protein [Brachybacterium massiliense]
MTGRTRSRPTSPAECTCKKAHHEHGTTGMYDRHKCGCDPCYAAARSRREARTDVAPQPADEHAIQGLFVATFPYYGGLSPQRLRRILRTEVAALAEGQGVRVLAGDLVVRIDRTGAGVFVAVAVPAETLAPLVEVNQRAAELAWRHEQAHPLLAKALISSIEEEAA